jgi:hypothetical protein
MKTIAIAAAALVLAASPGFAADVSGHGRHHGARPQLHSLHQRHDERDFRRIVRARAHLMHLRHRAWADGRVTLRERIEIRFAERQLARLLYRS